MSLSGQLRKSLVSSKTHLINRIQRANALIAQHNPATIDECEDLIDELTEVQNLLNTSIKNISTTDLRWTQQLAEYTDNDALAAEQDLYDATAANPNNGYLEKISEAEETIAQITTKMTKLQRVITRLTQDDPPERSRNSSQSNILGQNLNEVRHITIKPPKLVLPRFNGDVLKWSEFWSIFKANIHDRTDLTGVEKLSYLLPQLEGAARQAIEGLMICDDNYEVAIDILVQRFQQSNDRIVPMLYGELKQIPRSSTRRDDKRRTLDACDRIFRQMRVAGEDVDSSKMLTMDLLSKFPAPMVRDLQRHYKIGANSMLRDVRCAIDKSITEAETTDSILQNLDAMSGVKVGDTKPKPRQNESPRQNNFFSDHYNFGKQFSNENTAFAAVAGEWTTKFSRCVFCFGRHFNCDCERYKTEFARKQRLRQLKRCMRCTRVHLSYKQECREQVKCWYCKNDTHYSPLCPHKFAGGWQNPNRSIEQPPNDYMKKSFTPSKGISKQSKTYVAVSEEQRKENSPAAEVQKNITAMNHSAKPSAKTHITLFQSALVEVQNPVTKEEVVVRLCLDTLSNRSYATDALADRLSLETDARDNLNVSVFGSTKAVHVHTRFVTLNIKQRDGSHKQVQVNTTKVICDSNVLPSSWPEDEAKLLSSLKQSGSLADDPEDDRVINLLIGADYAWDFVTGAKIDTSTCIQLIPTTLGLMLAGRIMQNEAEASRETTMFCLTESSCEYPSEIGLIACESKFESKEPNIDEYWKLETIGISDCPIENEDELAWQKFNDTVQYEDGRYHVMWPWIEEKRNLLPTNFDVALRRFKSLSKRLSNEPDLFKTYKDIVQLQKNRGIIEKVSAEEIETTNTVHYLPHHPVIKPRRATTKVRIVYDASAKQFKSDVSLNECMLRGPVILPDLCKLLLRFRVHPIAIVSDIEKAFLQVALQPSERDATRFLWYEDETKPSQVKDNIAVFRFCRVSFGVISSPFLLGATIQHHLNTENTEFARKLSDEIYVDNIISGIDEDPQKIDYYQQTKGIFERAGMNLQQYCSNSESFMQTIPEKDRVKNRKTNVLGLTWDSETGDCLQLFQASKWQAATEKITKRSILKAVASIFDPLGLFQPVHFAAKLLLQKLWSLDYDWDDPVKDAVLIEEWNQLRKAIEPVFEIKLSRFVGKITDATLIVFSDASKKGYGTSAYLRTKSDSSEWTVNLLIAKSRLSPIEKKSKKQVTLPRLELLAATTGAQIATFCRSAFNQELRVYFFIDSECVLHWLRSNNLKRFVARRIDFLRSITNCEFRYVNTKDNPADLLTRGRTADELKTEQLWWHGPGWLTMSIPDWPNHELSSITNEALEEISHRVIATPISLTMATSTQPKSTKFAGMESKDASRLNKLLRVSCICLLFLKKRIWDRLSDESQQKSQLKSIFEALDSEEVDAENYRLTKLLWVKQVQQTWFSEVFSAIEKGKSHSLVQQLGLRIDANGLLRSYSRYDNVDVSDETKSPILLPKGDQFSVLVVREVHYRLHHSGVSHTLSELRREFWIPQGRSFVRNQLTKCIVCRKLKTGKPFALPDMPPWPIERVKRSTPFQFVGLDYFGPAKVMIGDAMQKMWVCLFSCLTTRAVHLEPVVNCTSIEFLQSLMRFIARRGCPQVIISDNAAQFHLVKILGDRAWKKLPVDESILSYSAENGIRWKFIVELAPWQGGHYERLVGVVKSVLKTAIGRRTLSWSDFVTLTIETESIVNNRPITYVADDVDSQSRVLRPIDFLIDRPTNIATTSDFNVRDFGESGKLLAAMWKSRKRQLDRLWRIWYEDYLTSLREQAQTKHRNTRGSHYRSPREDEVVLLHDPELPRSCWKLAKIVRLIPSADGNTRAAEIELSSGIRLRRAVNFLIPLEIEQEFENTITTSNEASQQVHVTEIQRPQLVPLSQTRHDARLNLEDEFHGFLAEDLLRAERALQQFDDVFDVDYQSNQ